MGLFDSIGKFFKRVTSSTVGKIIGGALLVGAAVFTGGAALGLAPLAGGWAGAAGSLAGSLGLTGTIGSAITGALTHAGYGTLIGGGLSAITGGDVLEGAATGALGGAVTGGITGGLSGTTGGLGSGLTETAETAASHAASSVGTSGSTVPVSDIASHAAASAGEGGLSAGLSSKIPESIMYGTEGAALTTGSTGGLGSRLAEAATSPEVLGRVIGGLGQGAMGYFGDQAEADMLREDQQRLTASYDGVFDGSGYSFGAPRRAKRPRRRFEGAGGGGRYEYKPGQGVVLIEG
tara:strand:+ start:1 stop:876 length:876 start_codon:yes stop_codon:yes gene_type:complete